MVSQIPSKVPVKYAGITQSYCLSTVAKMLQLSPRKFIQWLATNYLPPHRWLGRLNMGM